MCDIVLLNSKYVSYDYYNAINIFAKVKLCVAVNTKVQARKRSGMHGFDKNL